MCKRRTEDRHISFTVSEGGWDDVFFWAGFGSCAIGCSLPQYFALIILCITVFYIQNAECMGF